MSTDPTQQLGETLARVAKGEVPLSALAGLDAKSMATILGQAIAQMQIGRDEKALPIIEVLIALDEANPLFHEYHGLVLERLDRQDEAIAAYGANIERLETLRAASDRLCEAYLLRARLYAMRGELGSAGADVEAAKKNSAGADPELLREIGLLERAVREGA